MTAPVYAWAVKGPDGILPNMIFKIKSDARLEKDMDHYGDRRFKVVRVRIIEEVTDDQ